MRVSNSPVPRVRIDRWERAREAARGNWEAILANLAPDLSDALKAGSKKHVPCPSSSHPSRSVDGFRVYDDVAETGGGVCNTCGFFHDGFKLLQWLNGWSPKESLEAVESYMSLGTQAKAATPRVQSVPRRPPPSKEEVAAEARRKRRSLNHVWKATVSINDTVAEPARMYLARRGLGWSGATHWRFHPSLSYYEGKKFVGMFPALVAMVRTAGNVPVTLHRTYLTPDGYKAPVESPKKIMGYAGEESLLGSAVWLTDMGPAIAVAEGIETALAVQEAMNCCVVAALTAGMLAGFVPPPGVRRVLVMADKDRPSKPHPKGHGQEAASTLTRRLWEMGIQASALVPGGDIPQGAKSLDWLDIWNHHRESFPTFSGMRRAA